MSSRRPARRGSWHRSATESTRSAAEVDELVEQTDRAVDGRAAGAVDARTATARARTSSPSPRRPRRVGWAGSWARGPSCAPTTGGSRSPAPARPDELTGAMRAAPPVLDGPAGLPRTATGGSAPASTAQPVAIDFWSNVTMSPDFPSITEVIAQLYPASGGTPIDGAIAIDVESIARFLELTGPLQVERTGRPDAAHLGRRRRSTCCATSTPRSPTTPRATTCSRRSRRDSSTTSSAATSPARGSWRRPSARRSPRAGWSSGHGTRTTSRCCGSWGCPASSRRRTATASPSSARTPAPTRSTPTCVAASPTTPSSTRPAGGSGPP